MSRGRWPGRTASSSARPPTRWPPASRSSRYYAGLARNIFGRVTEVDHHQYSMLAREPMGVAGIIVPWNAPITLLVRSLAPCMAAGCAAVVKAAPQTALVNAEVFAMLADIDGLPAGAVNMLAETGSDVAQRLVNSPEVDVISYTGSTAVGKRIMAAGAATLKRMNLELGGSAPCVVFADADLDAAAAGIARTGMAHAGQVCVAASRVLAEESVAGALQARLAERLGALRLGVADDPPQRTRAAHRPGQPGAHGAAGGRGARPRRDGSRWQPADRRTFFGLLHRPQPGQG